MGAVLNVVRRPELLCCDEVLLVEQGLERFEDKCLVSLGVNSLISDLLGSGIEYSILRIRFALVNF
jgi:hypothetical protein